MPVRHFFRDHLERPVVEVGVLISTTKRRAQPRDAVFIPHPVRALVDAGASRSQVDIGILKGIVLDQTGEKGIFTASSGDQSVSMPLYLIDPAFVGDQPGVLARDLEVVGSDKLAGLQGDMLLGRDVLNRCLLIYDGANRRFSLAYHPPPEDPDD